MSGFNLIRTGIALIIEGHWTYRYAQANNPLFLCIGHGAMPFSRYPPVS